MKFPSWMVAVDRLTLDRFGMSVHDLPDMLFRDAFDDGASPEDFVDEQVTEMMREEFGNVD